jgi:putative spermidine/putrescine transport system substrate-binding protein
MTNVYGSYADDALELARERLAAGDIGRRAFLSAAAMFGAASALGVGPAKAAPSELVLVNFGGVAQKEYANAFGPGCMKATGLKLTVDGSGASAPKIKAMVDAGATVWDVCDYAPQIGIQLGAKYLEPIDYAIVDRKQIVPGFDLPYGCAAYVFSFIIAYNKQMLPEPPRNWKDFWDVKRFPGKRTMFKTPTGQIEAALLAAGVEPDKLYPLNLDLALGKIKELKSEIIWWETGAQSQQLFLDREVSMGNIWNTRATLLRTQSKAAVDFSFDNGVLMVGGWAIPKNNPAGAVNANKFIASAQNPAEQAKLFLAMFNGPANPRTADLIPAEQRPLNPTDPANLKLQIPINEQWWGDNNDATVERWLDAIS